MDTRPGVPLLSKPLAVRLGKGEAEPGPLQGQIPAPRVLSPAHCAARPA